jgi:hypothetical protein
MTRNSETPSNPQIKERIKPENYTPEMYSYFCSCFTANLVFITDDGATLETQNFFSLCIANISCYQYFVPELVDWLEKRSIRINEKIRYEEKISELEKFFKDYKAFFEKPTITLS